MATSKSSFSTDQVAILAAGYDSTAPEQARRDFVAEQAKAMGKPVRSIIGKLSTMKASHNVDYVPYTKAAPKARKATNQELVNTLSENTGIEVDVLNSLTRSSKAALEALCAFTTPTVAECDTSDEASGD